MEQHIIFECGICGCFHPWNFAGDCRDDSNRFGTPEDYIEATGCGAGPDALEIRSMEDRIEADENGE